MNSEEAAARPGLDREIAAVLGELAEESRERLGAHLEPERLLAHYQRELTPEGMREVEEHLLFCRPCASLLSDLDALFTHSGLEVAEGPSQEQSEAMWKKLAAALGGSEGGCGEDPVAPRVEPIPFPPRQGEPETEEPETAPRTAPETFLGKEPLARAGPWQAPARPAWQSWALPIAASLLLAVGALSVRVVQLQERVAALSQPQGNVAIFDLLPPGTRRGSGGEEPFQLPAGARSLLFVLPLPTGAPAGTYRAEVEDPAGETVVELSGLRPNEIGSLTLLLPRAAVGSGTYRVLLFSEGEPGAGPLLEFPLPIAAEPPPGGGNVETP